MSGICPEDARWDGAVSGCCPAPKSTPFVVGQWYWISYTWLTRYPDGTSTPDQTATELKECLALFGDKGLFDTDILGTKQIPLSCSAPGIALKRGFWTSLFS